MVKLTSHLRENKINVVTPINDLRKYFQFVLETTNMKCLTPLKAMEGDCGFLAANMYAQSSTII